MIASIQKYRFFLFLILLLGAQNVSAQTYYWVGGTGNWDDVSHWSNHSGAATDSSGPAIPYSTPPTIGSNVIFDTNSFLTATDTVHFNIEKADINSMSWTHSVIGLPFTPRFESPGNDTIIINRSLILDPLMDHAFGGHYYFTASDNDSIVTAGQNFFNDIHINNIEDTLTLIGDLNSTGGVFLTRGGLDISNRTLNVAFFRSNKNIERELFLANTNIHLTGSDSVLVINPSLLTKYGSNEIFHLDYAGDDPVEVSMGTDTLLWNQILLNNPVTQIISSAYFSSFSAISAEKVIINGNQVLRSPNFLLDGNCGKYLEITNSGTTNGFIDNDGVNMSMDFCKISKITAGFTGDYDATNSLNLGNNINIDFSSFVSNVDYYWVGGNGNFYDPTHWSLTSNGVPDACFPGPNDNVFFDANSGGIDTLFLLETIRVRTADFSGITNPLNFSGAAEEFIIRNELVGSSLLSSNWTGQFTVITFVDIQSNGAIWENDFVLLGPTDLLDNFQTTKNLTHNRGAFNSNGFDMSVGSFISDFIIVSSAPAFRSIDLSGSNVTITDTTFAPNDPASINSFAAPDLLSFTNVDNDFVFFNTAGYDYNDITINTSNVQIFAGTLNMGTFSIQPGSTVIFDNGSDHYFDDIIANGTCIAPILMRSSSANGTKVNLIRNANVVTTLSYVILDNIASDPYLALGKYIILNSTLLNEPTNSFWKQGGGINSFVMNYGANTLAAGASTDLSQAVTYPTPSVNFGVLVSGILSVTGIQTTGSADKDSCTLGLQNEITSSGATFQRVPNDDLGGTSSTASYELSGLVGSFNPSTLNLNLANDNTETGNFTIGGAQVTIQYLEANNVPAPTSYYWYGGSGDWSDINHWSLNSGNIPAAPATCLPNHTDNVTFDNLSFGSPNDTVIVDIESYVNDITWTSTVQPATLLVEKNLTTFGDVLFQPGLSVSRTNKEARFQFQPNSSTSDFNPNSALIDVPIALLGSSDTLDFLNLQNDLIMTDSAIIIIGGGKFETNDFDIQTGTLFFGSPRSKLIRLGSSTIKLHYGFQEDLNNGFMNFDPGTSSIEIDYIASDTIFDNYFVSNDHDFYDVSLNFNNEVYSPLTGDNTFHDLKIGAGSKIMVQSGSEQTVSDSLLMIGNCADSIFIISSSPSNTYEFEKLQDLSQAECVNVSDAVVIGSPINAFFSTDNGNNTDWTFDPTPSVTAQLVSISSYCFEDTLQFSQNSTAFYGPTTITWSFDNGDIISNDTTQYVYPNPGEYLLQFTAESANFCEDKLDTLISILDPKVILTSNETDTITCQGYETDFYADAQPDTLVLYEFIINGIAVNTPTLELDTLSITTLNDGDSVFVNVYEEGCPVTSDTLIFEVNPVPTTTISSNVGTTICSGDSVKLSGTGADEYQLYVNGTAVSPFSPDTVTLTNISHQDTLHFVGRLNGTLCEQESAELIFTVNNLPSASLIDDDSLSNTICQGDSVTWTATSATGVMYSFLVNGSSISNAPSPIFSYTGLNQGDVATVIATDAQGCKSPASNSLAYTVNVIPTPIISSDVNGICEGDLINFTANGISNYTFLINDVPVFGPSGANFYANASLANLDEVKVFGTLNNCPAFSNTIIINATPIPSISLVSDITDTICQGELPLITAVSSLANSFEFFINGISQGPSSSSNTFTPSSGLANGNILSAKGSLNGCESQDQINFVVNPSPNTIIFTDNNSDTTCQADPLTITGTGGSSYAFFVNGVNQGVTTSTLLTDTLVPGPNETYVIASNSFNCSTTSDTLDLFIVGLPTVNLASDATANTICAGTPITFTATPGAEAYQFFLNSNSLGLPNASNTYSSTSITDGDSIVVIAYNNGCPKNGLDTVIVSVINNPLASIAGTSVYCASAPSVFTAGTGTDYQFQLNSVVQGPPSSLNTFDGSSLTPGNYALQVLVSENGCSATSTVNLTVLTTPTASISGNSLICSGDNTVFQGTGASNYEFFVNGISSGTSSTFATTSLVDGDVVSVIASTLVGCPSTNTAEITMTVNTTPAVTLISDDADGILCQGQNVLFTAFGATDYEFFVNGISTGPASSANTFASNSTTNGQTISVSGSSTGCFDTDSLPVFVVVGFPVVSLTNAGDTSLCTGDLTQLTVSGATDYLYYVNGIPQGVFSPTTTFNNTVANGDMITVEGVTNTCVSLATTSVQYSVFNYPVTTLTSSAVNNEICLGEQVTFTGTGAANYAFFIDNLPAGNGSSSFTTTELTDGQIIALIASNGECSTPATSIPMIVNTMNLNGSITPSNYMICEGDDITFQMTGADEYEVFVNGLSQGAQGATSSYTLSNLVDLDLISFTGFSNTTSCLQNEDETTYIHVSPSPVVTIDQNTTICEGDSTILTSNSSYGNQWLLNGTPIVGAVDTSLIVVNSGDYSLSVTKGGNGNVWSQGYNGNGEIGDGTNFNSDVPAEALNINSVENISSGTDHTMALLPNGDLYVWGSNLSGQLGNGTFTSSNAPIQLTSLPVISEVAGGDKFTVATSSTGSLFTWGENNFGQLGLSNTTVYNSPQLVASQTNVTNVAAGIGHAMILKADSTVWAAGNNDFGQLGLGNVIASTSFVQIPGLNSIVTIEAGEYHSMAIDVQGNLFVWGNNGSGQLGLNDLTNRLSPESSPLKKVAQISGGNSHTIAVSENGSVYTMGANTHGQLGTNDTQDQISPQKIAQLNAVQSISAGQYISLILKKDGTVLGTGRNNEHAINSSAALIVDSFEIIAELAGVTGISGGQGVAHFIFGNENECSSPNVVMTVNAAPLPVVFYTNGELSTTVTNVASYQWFINGVDILDSDTSAWTPTSNGFYTVLVTYQNGCSRISEQFPIGVIGLKDLTKEITTVVYPNPTIGQTNVVWNQKGFYTSYVVLDVTGREIFRGEIRNEMLELPIDLLDQSSGIYNLILAGANGQYFKHKLIKL